MKSNFILNIFIFQHFKEMDSLDSLLLSTSKKDSNEDFKVF